MTTTTRFGRFPARKMALSLAVAIASQALPALAQDDGEVTASALEEVIVTGTKRDVSQQDLPIAVSTITAAQLEKTFQNDVTELAQLSPNVTLTPQNGFNAIGGGMRGTGFISILVTKDPSVGLTVDDYAFNHVQSQFVEIFDIEQVEIFRGPQGTLFGKNTTGGAIAFTTIKPEVGGELAGRFEVNYGQFTSNDSDIEKFKFAINVPLGDTLAARLSVIRDYTDGYWSNTKPMGGDLLCFACSEVTGDPNSPSTDSIRSTYPTTGDGRNIGGKDVLAGKLKFRWEPNDWMAADLIFEHVDDDSETPATANDTPSGEGYIWPLIGFPGWQDQGISDPFITGQSYTQTKAIDMASGHQIDADGIYLNMEFDLGNYVVKAITGMRDQDEILASTYTGEAYTSLYDASRNTTRETSQLELRVASQFDGPFNFVSGAAMYNDDLEFVVFGNLGFFLPLAAADFYRETYEIQYTSQDRKTWAVYGDGSFEVTDRLTLTGGVRYTHDEKDFVRLNLGGGGGNPVSNFITLDQWDGPFTNPLPESAFGNVQKNSETWTKTTFRIVADYKFTDDLMGYASFATGFVAGGFSETCGSPTSCSAYDAEENENIEIGVKADLLDGSLRLNAAYFNTTYESLQRDTVVTIKDAAGNTFQETQAVNVGESTAQGIEVEMQWAVTDNIRIDGNLGWLDHEYDDYRPGINPADLGITGAGGQINPDLSGLEVPFSPELNYGIGVSYFQDLSSGAMITYNVNMHYQDDAQTSSFPANVQGGTAANPVIKQKANTQLEERTLVNGYITYTGTQGFEISVYGKNLTDERYRVSANPVATLWNFSRFGPPREYGVQIGYSF